MNSAVEKVGEDGLCGQAEIPRRLPSLGLGRRQAPNPSAAVTGSRWYDDLLAS